MEKLQPGVYAAAAACLLSTAAVAFLQQRRAGNAAGETQEEPDRWQIRGRLLLLFLWILLTLAALVLTNRGY
jgi:hypothetical protein